MLMPKKTSGLTLVELLAVLATLSVLIGLLLPAIVSAREAARRTQCTSNLRQLGLGVLGFESAHRAFPASGWTHAGPGNPHGRFLGWRVLILPYLDQQQLQDLYDVSKNWWEAPNVSAASVPIDVFQCPSVPELAPVTFATEHAPRPSMSFPIAVARTDYEALLGIKPASINLHLASPRYDSTNRFSVMHRNSKNQMKDIRDGVSRTAFISECGGRPYVFRRKRRVENSNDQGICWADSEGPFSLDGSSSDGSREGKGPASRCTFGINRRNDNEPYSFHPDGASFLFADGRVSYMSEDTELLVLVRLITRNGSER